MLIIAGVEKQLMLICCNRGRNVYTNKFEGNELVECYLFYDSKSKNSTGFETALITCLTHSIQSRQ
jgi:hypothetical protein